jgi:hypothetical protein
MRGANGATAPGPAVDAVTANEARPRILKTV